MDLQIVYIITEGKCIEYRSNCLVKVSIYLLIWRCNSVDEAYYTKDPSVTFSWWMVKLTSPASCNLFFKFSRLFSWRPWLGCDSERKTTRATSNTGKHSVFIVERESSTECWLSLCNHVFNSKSCHISFSHSQLICNIWPFFNTSFLSGTGYDYCVFHACLLGAGGIPMYLIFSPWGNYHVP